MTDEEAKAVAPPKRAFGRSLSDFWLGGEEGKLHPAEERLMEACRTGEACKIADERPEAEAPDNLVRAGLVRFLALGGDETTPVHEYGVLLSGAWIEGEIDLAYVQIARPLVLQRCRIERIEARDAELHRLDLRGTRLERGLTGEGLRCGGSVFLSAGFHASAEVRLTNSQIGGNFECAGGRFDGGGGDALVCDRAAISGSVFMRGHAIGAVRLVGAQIGGSLDCLGGRFDGGKEAALLCDGTRVSRSVFLNSGFQAKGEVRLLGSQIGGNLSCSNGRFDGSDDIALICDSLTVRGSVFLDEGFQGTGAIRMLGAQIAGDLCCDGGRFDHKNGTALQCQSAAVGGALILRSAKIAGGIDLTAAHVASLVDNFGGWQGARGRIILDGFTYDRIAGTPAFVDSDQRIAWLKMQRSDLMEDDFRPQPWEQLTKVLRDSGHPNEARKVAREKQEQLRRAGKIKGFARVLHWLYGVLVGYGYLPTRLLGIMAGVWLFGGAVFLAASLPEATPLSPRTSAFVLAERPRTQAVATQSGSHSFYPLLYSADALLPIDLGYQSAHKLKPGHPAEPWLLTLAAAETIFGWIASLLLLAVATNLLKKD